MTIAQIILAQIELEWEVFEQFLQQPTHFPEFKNYLSNYRGLSQNNTSFSYKNNEVAKNSATSVLYFFHQKLQAQEVFKLNYQEALPIFEELEKKMNLVLYYWCGLNDKNYQWRTWIHFFDLEKVSLHYPLKDGHSFHITLSEYGLYFGENNEERYPKIMPISQLFPFLCPNTADLAHKNKLNTPASEQNAPTSLAREYFAMARALQREVCLFIDEWEYQNSILAVEYSQAVRQKQDIQPTLNKMDLKRNHFAAFGLASLRDFQNGINPTLKEISHPDFIAECDALCALMLSAVQKLLLPASLSRMAYSSNVIELLGEFFIARVHYCPEDYSAKLAIQATQSALEKDFNPELFKILEQKPYEWKLSFDPSSVLKAFSWSYSSQHHNALCKLMGICYVKKSHTNSLNTYLIENLKSTFDVQKDFLAFLKREMPMDTPFSINKEVLEKLEKAYEILFKN